MPPLTSFTATLSGANSATLSWTPPTSGVIVSFNVLGVPTMGALTGVTATGATVTNLPYATTTVIRATVPPNPSLSATVTTPGYNWMLFDSSNNIYSVDGSLSTYVLHGQSPCDISFWAYNESPSSTWLNDYWMLCPLVNSQKSADGQTWSGVPPPSMTEHWKSYKDASGYIYELGSSSSVGGGVLRKSTDNGATFTVLDTEYANYYITLVKKGPIMIVPCWKTPPNYKYSLDSGASWTKVSAVITPGSVRGVYSPIIDGSDVYMWDGSHQITTSLSDLSHFTSTTLTNANFPFTVVFDPRTNPKRYVGACLSGSCALKYSYDCGKTWTDSSGGPPAYDGEAYTLQFDGTNFMFRFAGRGNPSELPNLYTSPDGMTWSVLPHPVTGVRFLAGFPRVGDPNSQIA